MADNVSPVTDAEFESKVLQAGKPVLVDFWATWCGPCRMIAPVVEDLANQMGDRVTVLKMDVDQNPSTTRQLGIMSIPTVIIFKDGRPAERIMGYRPTIKSDLKQKLEALL
jgi:thioredoxin 1